MKTRQFVWSDSELTEYVRQNFVVVAGDDVKIRGAGQREKGEWRLLSAGTKGFTQQGIYAMSSAGEPLGYLNRGWPDPAPKEILQAMRESVATYRALPKSRRVLEKPLDPTRDKLVFEESAFTKPPKTLDLRITSRGLPFEGMTSFDQRNPMFHHTDRLWFREDEWREFLPTSLTVGARRGVTGPGRTRIVLLSHHQAGPSAWWEEHIVGGETTSTVKAVRGQQVDLEIVGTYRMRANSEWCKDSYDGRLLAKATFDRAQDRFTRFDLAMLGRHTVGERRENIHQGSLTADIAAAASLSPAGGVDSGIPTNWKYGYSLNWCRGR